MSPIGANIAPALSKPIGFLDVIGHSGITDSSGVTAPDFGLAHKIDQHLQPAIYRSVATGGAIHAKADAGNGASGDGGWGRAALEFHRQDDVWVVPAVSGGQGGYASTTMTGTTAAGANTALPVGARDYFYANEWIVVGQGANTELCQVVSSYVGAGGAGTITVNSTANAHLSGDPVFHAIRNVGAFLAKSSLVVLDTGGNDVPVTGPFAQGTFGTTAGASRGLAPFKHAYRFTLSQMRCAAIYLHTHASCVYGTGWSVSTAGSNWSNPPSNSFGLAGYHYTQTQGTTVTFTTDPDFPGGTVAFFSMSYSNGEGSVWSFAVSGATTRTLTSVFDTRNVNIVVQNAASPTMGGTQTGCVYRITGLNPGVNTIVATVTTLSTYGIFLGWGVEAPNPPLIVCPLQYRIAPATAAGGYGYGTWGGSGNGYIRRSPMIGQTATVTAGAGTAANAVTLGTAVTIGTTATSNAAVYPGDTITIGAGTGRETRRVVGVDSTTTLHVDAAFVNAHAGEQCIIGFQDEDFVGGGYVNPSDTQGKASVPGLNATALSVIGEFDSMVQPFYMDSVLNPPGAGSAAIGLTNLDAQGVHSNNAGASIMAAAFMSLLSQLVWPTAQIALATVPNKRTWIPVYGEAYPAGQPATGQPVVFLNGWSNVYPLNVAYAPVGYYKDSRTRMVYIRGAVTCVNLGQWQLPSAMFVLPIGYRPAYQLPIEGTSTLGPAGVEIDSQGNVWVISGFWQSQASYSSANGVLEFEGSFLAEL